ncbi:MAG: methyltransferase domain-containing protein [Alphaproteobacteria bacterium]|nr:methyltransferase domain-containing protein [Alphaproteobacteria bacterium]
MSTYTYSRDHLVRPQYERFFAEEQEIGWEAAIEAMIARRDVPKSSKVPFFLSDQKRNDFVFLLPIEDNSVVLDYGAGWGNTSYTFSKYCKQVIALDADFDRLHLANRHFAYRGANNVQTIYGGTSWDLPFADATFDIVVFNGVLEWMPLSMEGVPTDVHRRVLGEINRVLKPGGSVMISIENRFGYRHLMGNKDYHCGGLRWAPFLPRALANLYSQFWLGRPYRAWFHSYNILHELLADCGYEGTKIYSYYPDHVKYSCIFPLDDENVLRKTLKRLLKLPTLRKSERLLFKFFSTHSSFKYFAQDFLTIGYKPK